MYLPRLTREKANAKTMATQDTSTDTSSTQSTAASQAGGTGISRDTLIAERNRGKLQGQRAVLRELGVESIDELKARLAGGSKPAASASGAPTFDPEELAEMIGRAVDQRLSPLTQDLAAQKQAREAAAKDAEAKAKAQQEASQREAEEAAEVAAAEKAYKAEVAKLREIAESAGAKVKDKATFDKLLKRVQVELQMLEEDEFEERFGEGATQAQYAANVKELLADIRKSHPSLFVEEAKKDAPQGAAAGVAEGGAQAQQTAAAATTSKPASGAPASAAAAQGTPRVLDTRKLSPKQFAEYNKNRDAFRRKFEQGLIDYDKK